MTIAVECSSRSCFTGAAAGFAELTRQVQPDAWDHPALGTWTVRDLVGHTGRALSTIETYLGQPPVGPSVAGPAEYFLAVRGADPAAIAQRGREAGAALGDDPAAAVAQLTRRVTALVEGTADDAPVASPAGVMTLAGYLPTRTFELAVHSLDLARALHQPPPAALGPAVGASCELAGRLAARQPSAPELLLLLTGRTGLPPGLGVV